VTVEVIPLRGVPEVTAGDDLTGLVLEACRRAGLTLADGDVICVAQKVVS
jgi:coenzyme F420-0:L-glutamate ligase / coenzyme F420-1:gamma-L-glutamate ligase